jgi:hypothetical protein
MKTVLCGIIFMSVWQYGVLQMKFFLVIGGKMKTDIFPSETRFVKECFCKAVCNSH